MKYDNTKYIVQKVISEENMQQNSDDVQQQD